jgi:hypothetical protein
LTRRESHFTTTHTDSTRETCHTPICRQQHHSRAISLNTVSLGRLILAIRCYCLVLVLPLAVQGHPDPFSVSRPDPLSLENIYPQRPPGPSLHAQALIPDRIAYHELHLSSSFFSTLEISTEGVDTLMTLKQTSAHHPTAIDNSYLR